MWFYLPIKNDLVFKILEKCILPHSPLRLMYTGQNDVAKYFLAHPTRLLDPGKWHKKNNTVTTRVRSTTRGYVLTRVCLFMGGEGVDMVPGPFPREEGEEQPSQACSWARGYPSQACSQGGHPSQACSRGKGYPSQTLGQGYHPPTPWQDQDSGNLQDNQNGRTPLDRTRTGGTTPPPLQPQTWHATDMICHERYASCGHVGGLSCLMLSRWLSLLFIMNKPMSDLTWGLQ